MLITIGGTAASGKTTLAKRLAKKFGFTHVSAGEVMRQLAKEKHMTLLEFSAYAEKDKNVDLEIDALQQELAKKGDCVVDGRLSAYKLAADYKIFLTCPLELRAQRVMEREPARFTSLEQAKIAIKKRSKSEVKRYQQFYDIDLEDLSIYDLIINTSRHDQNSVETIVSAALANLS